MRSVLPGLKLAEAPTPGTKVLANKLLSRWNDRDIEDRFQSCAQYEPFAISGSEQYRSASLV
jgi:hypothetical protein